MKKLTSKKIHEKVKERSEGLCEVCKGNRMVQHHHIVSGNGCRTQHETVESVIALCWNCHHGNNGWHGKNSAKIKQKLRAKLQDQYFDQGFTEEQVREKLGGNFY